MNMIEGEMLRRAQLRRDATQSIEAAVEYFTERHPEMSTQEVWGLAELMQATQDQIATKEKENHDK